MIQPKFKVKTAKKEKAATEAVELKKELLMTSCSGDLAVFPEVWDIESRLSCYVNNNGIVNTLNAFWDATKSAVKRIFIVDGYFLEPEVPPGTNKTQLTQERLSIIQSNLLEACLSNKSGLEVKILTVSPYSEDKAKEQKMLSDFEEIELLVAAEAQQGTVSVKLDVCLNLTKHFDRIHDRFAIVDDELWHFGGTVGGFNSKFSAASRGWDAEKLGAVSFFDEVWQRCNR